MPIYHCANHLTMYILSAFNEKNLMHSLEKCSTEFCFLVRLQKTSYKNAKEKSQRNDFEDLLKALCISVLTDTELKSSLTHFKRSLLELLGWKSD